MSVHRGKVTRVDGDAAFVQVPGLGAGEFGPLQVVRHRLDGGTWSGMPLPGDRVVVAAYADDANTVDDLVVLGVRRG